MRSMSCTRCGSSELTEIEGLLQCVYCQSRYEIDKELADSPKPVASMTSQQQIEKFGTSYGETSAASAAETVLARGSQSKSGTVALLLSIFFGWLGVDRL